MNAKSDAIRRVVSGGGMFCPRFDVMDFQLAAALLAILARPVVSLQNRIAEPDVKGVVAVLIANRGCAPLPKRMFGADENLRVVGRSAPGFLYPAPNRRLVFIRKTTPMRCGRDPSDGLLPRIRGHHLRCPSEPRTFRKFLSNVASLGWVISQIPIRHLARIGTKISVWFPVGGTTLYAN